METNDDWDGIMSDPEHISQAKKWAKNRIDCVKEEYWHEGYRDYTKWCEDEGLRINIQARDFAWRKAEEEIREYRESRNKTGSEETKHRSWSEIDALTFPENMWRVKFLIPKESVVFIAGQSGGRKTWLAMDLMEALTKPRNFLNCERFGVEGCNVLYIDPEMGEYLMRRRGRQLDFNAQREHEITIISNSINLNSEDDQDLDYILDLIQEKDIEVVIVDTFRGAAGGIKEEKAEEIRMFFEKLRPLKELGISLIFLDHLRKPSHFEGKKPKKEHLFASMDKVAISDILIMIHTEEASEITSVYQRKNRLAPELKPFTFRMEDTSIDSDNNKTTLIYEGEIDDNDSKLEQAQEVILEALEDGPKTRKQLIAIVYKQKKIAERTASEACRTLEANEHIEVTKKGRENLYSSKPPDTPNLNDKSMQNNDGTNNTAAKLPINELTG